jgi:hypothetical protein
MLPSFLDEEVRKRPAALAGARSGGGKHGGEWNQIAGVRPAKRIGGKKGQQDNKKLSSLRQINSLQIFEAVSPVPGMWAMIYGMARIFRPPLKARCRRPRRSSSSVENFANSLGFPCAFYCRAENN